MAGSQIPPGTAAASQPPQGPDLRHSADSLLEASRDYWWNGDFLELMGRRLQLDRCRRVLDVGCGRGHWSRSLAATLSADAEISGVDREAGWIADAEAWRDRMGLGSRFSYLQGSAQDLPFDDSSFDLVTCQTLFIHLPDPQEVLREMLRVLQPGGLLLAAEPSNICQSLRWSSLIHEDFLDEHAIDNLLGVVRFYLVCSKGKQVLGEGFSSIGDLLPGYFRELGLGDVRVFQTDKAAALVPPYSAPEQSADVADILTAIEAGRYIWREDQSRRYFLAGGGTEAEFSRFWRWAMNDNARLREQLNSGRYHAAGGHSTYLISGRKTTG